MKSVALFFVLGLLCLPASLRAAEKKPAAPPAADFLLRELRYDGQLAEKEARFTAELDLEVTGKGEASVPLFEGDVAVLTTRLPQNLRLVRERNQYRLIVSKPGRLRFKLDLVAKITKAEPWNQVTFTGPAAVISSIAAQVSGSGMELQLLTGTVVENPIPPGTQAEPRNLDRVRGLLGSDRVVSLRWQSKTAEEARAAVLICETVAAAHINPSVVKYTTELRYDIPQGKVSRLTISLPAAQTMTRLQGGQIRDWQVKTDGDWQTLTVEFIKPIEKSYRLTVFSEQPVESDAAQLVPPLPLEVARETGWLSVYVEDVLAETSSLSGMRQVNSPAGAIAAYQFFGRAGFDLALKLKRIEPVLTAADRVSARLEEARLVIAHSLAVTVEKAGIYALELMPQTSFIVADVRGEGVEDWRTKEGKLHVTFNNRVLGVRKLEVQLEQSLKAFTNSLTLLPLRVAGATKETSQIGAASVAGIQLKTAEMTGVREVPAALRAGESLAYTADQPDWTLKLSAEKQTARVIAEIFNLITIGDGLLGGSATIRYAIVNQGVQEFRVRVPVEWKNVEFTGPNIRRKELATTGPAGQQTNIWTISLQDKAWGGYTLVVTYDAQFDPHKATLALGGAHALDVERESGSVAVTAAANVQLAVKTAADPLRRVDESELSAADHALITRPVLQAFQYEGGAYDLSVDVARFAEVPVLEAVADRTQITTVLTEEGQMLTQASFMVKNNDKQFQRFTLPKDAKFWGAYVNNAPVKAEKDADALLVPLPRGADRDTAFAVDIVYAQKIAAIKSAKSAALALEAPKTDVPNTYNEWELYVPPTHRLAEFGGNMTVQRGTTYDLRDAWNGFLNFYRRHVSDVAQAGAIAVVMFLATLLLMALVRRGWRGAIGVLAVLGIVAVLAGMMMPALSKAKMKASSPSKLAVLFDDMVQSASGPAEAPAAEAPPPPASTTWGMAREKDAFGRSDRLKDEVKGERQVDAVKALAEQTEGKVAVGGAFATASGEARNRVAGLNRSGSLALSPHPSQPAKRTTPADGQVGADFATADGLAVSGTEHKGGRVITGVGFGAVGGGGGGGGGGVGGDASGFANYALAAATVSGIRPVHIDLPRTGERFVFTKVLNVHGEALTISTLAMDARAFRLRQAGLQLAGFVMGGLFFWWQWRRAAGNSFLLAVGLALVLASIGSLLLAERLLHLAFILAAPVIPLVLLLWALIRFWKRSVKSAPAAEATNGANGAIDGTSPSPSPVAPLIALLLFATSATNAATPNLEKWTGRWHFDGDAKQLCFVYLESGAIQFVNEKGDQTKKVTFLDEVTVKSDWSDGSVRAQLSADAKRIDWSNGTYWTRPVTRLPTPRLPRTVERPGQTPSILSANYTLSVGEKAALVEAVLNVITMKPDQRVVLFGEDVAVQEFLCSQKEARLLREGGGVSVLLPKAGAASVTLKFLVKHSGDVTKRQLGFAIPPALTSQLTATLSEPDAVVDAPTAVMFQSRAGVSPAQSTVVEAIIGAGERIELTWTPRVKRAAEIAATVFVQNATVQTLAGGVVNTRVVLDYQVTQGELRQARVRLPAGQKLMRVEGEGIRTWRLADEKGESVLVVELAKGVTPTWRLTLELEQAMTAPPSQAGGYTLVKLEVPHAIDVKRESGLVALKTADDLSLSVETAKELQKVDSAEFHRAVASPRPEGRPVAAAKVAPPEQFASAFRFLKPEFELTVRVETVQPQIEAVVRNAFRLETEQVFIAAQADFTIKRAGVFTLRLALPKDFRVESVTGDKIAQWIEKRETGTLEVTLKERVQGAYQLRVSLSRVVKELPKTLELAGVHPLGAQKLSGLVAVAAEEGVQVKSESFTELSEIPAASLPRDIGVPVSAGVLAFKFITTEPGDAPAWKLAVATEKMDPWVRAEVVNWITVKDALVSGRTLLRYEIANAPTKEFQLRVPAAFKNVEINGADIRRRDQNGDTWRVELQNKKKGIYQLAVTWEQPWNVKDKKLPVSGVVAQGVDAKVERETGSLVFVVKPPLQVAPESASAELLRIDPRELPDWAGHSADTAALAYRYLRPGYQLALTAQRYTEAEVLQALVDSARLTTVVSEDGQMMTQLTLAVRNNGRQSLEVSLPNKEDRIWSAFVAGQAVRPTLRDGKLLLPMERSGADESAIAVELIYVSAQKFPKGKGAVALASPRLDVPLKNARWELYLPPGYAYTDFTGTMARVADEEPVYQAFTSGEYEQVESDNKRRRDEEFSVSLSNAGSLLAGGKVKEANEFLNRANNLKGVSRAGQLDGDKGELAKLNSDVQRSLARGLQERQSEVTLNYQNANAPAQQQAQAPTALAVMDEDAAEKQTVKLQQAQEIAVSKVQPLHVNLPQRGLRFTFGQPLQTEIGKEMTVNFLAADTRAVNWTARTVASLAAFLVLWALLAAMTRRQMTGAGAPA